jgi:hypothetical protein
MNTFRKSVLSSLGGIMVALSVATMAAPATAAVPSTADIRSGEIESASSALPPDVQAQADEFAQYESVLLESVSGSEGARTFDLNRALSRGVPAGLATDFAEGISLTGGSVSGDFTPSHPKLDAGSIRVLSACVGETHGWMDGIGAHARLNSCDTATLVSILSQGANLGALAAVLSGFGGGVYAAGGVALMAALLQVGASSISACAADGTGVEIYAAGYICWAQ